MFIKTSNLEISTVFQTKANSTIMESILCAKWVSKKKNDHTKC